MLPATVSIYGGRVGERKARKGKTLGEVPPQVTTSDGCRR